MRLLAALAIGCALAGAPSPARAASLDMRGTVDTTVTVRFDIPAQSLARALVDFSRQAGVRVQVDVSAASAVQAPALSGAYTVPVALRALLAGSGMTARFADNSETVMVAREGTRVHALTPINVIGVRTRGYATTRTSSATKTDTPLRDAPQSVSVVTREVIADQAMQNMSDVVRYVPGITMGQGEGHRDAPTIRGNSTTADFFVDGVRDDVQYFRDLYNLERVEALKGSNAMIFGRGGGGGVINRVTKQAQWAPVQAFTLEGGSFEHARGTLDFGQGLGSSLAVRFNGMYENSEGFREANQLRRFGVNPTLALALGAGTTIRAGYEYFDDHRVVDRGIPSYQGRPSSAPLTEYFGNPDSSYADARVHLASALVEHVTPFGLTLRNRTTFGAYDKHYQNSLPGAVSADGSTVALSAYANSTDRQNLFNQTDLVYTLNTGSVKHTLLGGVELSRQATDNFRTTGYYNNTATSFSVPFNSPTVTTPITFRQSATDADNHSVATVAAVYAQNQVELTSHLQAVVGLRFDRFAVDFHNNRNGDDLSRTDELVSPRAGLVLKPVEAASIYGSYSISYLPSSGDQFSSLTASTETLEPEQFTNYEVGAKWDVRQGLALSAAYFQLDRTNTTSPDPANPGQVIQTGSQRTTGLEVNATGSITPRWQVVGGLSLQRARITSTTSAAPEGRRVPLVPESGYSLWTRYQVHPILGLGLGVTHRADMWAAIDNSVTLPGYTRADGAVFLKLGRTLNAQLNVENLLDEEYYATSHGNNNIMPGASRTVRLSLSARR